MNIDNDQASITPVSQQYLKIDSTGSLWIPTGTTAQRPSSPSAGFFRYNSDTPGIEYWNGSTWISVPTSGGGSGSVDTASVVWYFSPSQCRFILNESTMVIDLSTIITDVSSTGISFAAGQSVFIHAYSDPTKNGIYTLGSVASLSAVTLTRHADWPAAKVIPCGLQLFVQSFPIYYDIQSVDSFSVSDVDASANTIAPGSDVGRLIVFTGLDAGAVMPGGLSINTPYYTLTSGVSGSTYSSTIAGSTIDITTTGTNGSSSYIANIQTADGPFEALSGTLTLIGNDTAPASSSTFSFNNGLGLAIVTSRRYWTPTKSPSTAVDGKASGGYSVAVGYGALAGPSNFSTAIGNGASANNGIAIGTGAYGAAGGTAIGTSASAPLGGVAIGGTAFNNAAVGLAIGTGAVNYGEGSTVIGDGDSGGYVPVGVNQPNSLALGHGDVLGGNGTMGLLFAKTVGFTSNATPTALTFGSNAFYEISNAGYWELSGTLTAQDTNSSHECVMWKIEGFANLDGSSTSSDIRLTRIATTTGATAKALTASLAIGWHAGSSTVRLTGTIVGTGTEQHIWWLWLGGARVNTALGINTPLSSSMVSIKTGTAITVTTSEALSAGDVVNIHNSSGIKCRKASASSAYEAHGFVLEDTANGAVATVYVDGENPYLSGLTTGGKLYLSTTSGGVTHTMPSSGNLVQALGIAMSTTKMNFVIGEPVQT